MHNVNMSTLQILSLALKGALLSGADINVIWSSTVGLECIARHKSVLVWGKPYWLDLNWGIHAWSVNDLRSVFQ